MTAEPVGVVMWSPDPVRQRLRDHTVEDALDLPEDAPRVEIDNGVVIVVPKPTIGHDNITDLVGSWLRQHAPEQFVAGTEAGVAVGCRDAADSDTELVLSEAFEIRLPIRDIAP
jgi:Uma2 family endonuclease